MTGEPMYTSLEERMVPDLLFLCVNTCPNCNSEVFIMLHFQLCSAHYTALQ